MSRKNRIKKPGAFYHVIATINRNEKLLVKRDIKKMFLDTIARAKKKYAFKIKNFCLMDSHIHLLIQPEKTEDLSLIML